VAGLSEEQIRQHPSGHDSFFGHLHLVLVVLSLSKISGHMSVLSRSKFIKIPVAESHDHDCCKTLETLSTVQKKKK
jgi:hypothetical protein